MDIRRHSMLSFSMAKNVVFLVHGMGRQNVDKQNAANSWYGPVEAALDDSWSKFDCLKPKKRADYIEYRPISYHDVFADYLKEVGKDAKGIGAELPDGTMAKFFEGLGEAGADPNFFWDDVADVLLYRFGGDLFKKVHLRFGQQLVAAVNSYLARDDARDIRFFMITHSLGTAVANGALNRIGGNPLGDSAAFVAGGPFFLTTYMSIANVSRVLWWGGPDIYAKTIVRPASQAAQTMVEVFLNFHHVADPFTYPLRFAPKGWGRAYEETDVEHIHEVNVHGFEHYLNNPRVSGTFLQSIMGEQDLPTSAIEQACAEPPFAPFALVSASKRDELGRLRDALAVDLADAFEGDAVIDGVEKLLGKAFRLAWKFRKQISDLLGAGA